MPTYEYACSSCGEHLEIVQSFRDEPLTECPACGGPLRKVFGSIGVVFKGSGFYKTDSRPAKSGSSSSSSAAESGSGGASGSGSGTGESSSGSTSGADKKSDASSGSGGGAEKKSESSGKSGSSGGGTSSGKTAAAS